jgi:hypothetical protein
MVLKAMESVQLAGREVPRTTTPFAFVGAILELKTVSVLSVVMY